MVVCNMSKKKAKKKGKLTAPIVAGFLLIGAVGSIGGDDSSTSSNNTATQKDQTAIVETVPEEKERIESVASEKVEQNKETKEEQTAPSMPADPAPQKPEVSVDPEQALRDKLAQYNYVGSSESDKYHKPKCKWTSKINDGNLVHFDTEDEAESAGYEPCGTCKP
jgi:hypothetical protein